MSNSNTYIKYFKFFAILILLSLSDCSFFNNTNVNLINAFWHVKWGDDPEFVNPDFDDSDWSNISIFEKTFYPPNDDEKLYNVLWLRKQIRLRKSNNQILNLELGKINGLYELYFDGELLGRGGNFGENYYYNPYEYHIHSIPANLTKGNDHHIAICIFTEGKIRFSDEFSLYHSEPNTEDNLLFLKDLRLTFAALSIICLVFYILFFILSMFKRHSYLLLFIGFLLLFQAIMLITVSASALPISYLLSRKILSIISILSLDLVIIITYNWFVNRKNPLTLIGPIAASMGAIIVLVLPDNLQDFYRHLKYMSICFAPLMVIFMSYLLFNGFAEKRKHTTVISLACFGFLVTSLIDIVFLFENMLEVPLFYFSFPILSIVFAVVYLSVVISGTSSIRKEIESENIDYNNEIPNDLEEFEIEDNSYDSTVNFENNTAFNTKCYDDTI
ncbi:MAG: hypothetical protein ACOCWM_05425, partial [Cyclobacteriaceae bacterium]